MTHIPAAVWPCLTYRDASAAIEFLEGAFGFTLTARHNREDDEEIVEHAELRWPLGGGVMLGTAGKDDSEFSGGEPGSAMVYLVCESPDELFERASGAGATVVMPLRDTDYGSRDFAVRDPEGTLWCFGTYAGE